MGIGGILRGSVHLEISLLWPSPLLARVLLCEVQRPQRHDGGGGEVLWWANRVCQAGAVPRPWSNCSSFQLGFVSKSEGRHIWVWAPYPSQKRGSAKCGPPDT